MRKTIVTILMIIAVSIPALRSNAMTDAERTKRDKAKVKIDAADRLYSRATRALDDERWSDAVDGFKKVVEHGGPNTDRALYWLAYAQFKSGRGSEALTTTAELRRRFPSSAWIDDAKSLEIEIRQSAGQKVSPEDIHDDELKLIAVTSLLNADPDRAVTLLEKMLKAPGGSDTKSRALFVLGQMQSPRAQKLLEDAARGAYGAALQEEAIRAIATVGGGARNKPLLIDIYQKSHDDDVKEAILQAFMIMGDREHLLQVASGDSNADMRSNAARLLGTMHATAELERLYATEKSAEVKEDIIQGFFIAGDATKLEALARQEPNADLREAAIRGLGTMGAKRTGELLMQLWNGTTDLDTKEAIVEAFFVQGNASTLVALARKEQNRELKRDIVQKLSVMRSREAQDYMMELLKD